MKSSQSTRTPGLLYLAVIVFGIFAELTRQAMISADNPTATMQAVMDNQFQLRLALLSDLLMITSYLLLALALYQQLHLVNEVASKLFVIFVIVCVPVLTINLLNHYALLLLVTTPTAFSTSQLASLVYLSLQYHGGGYVLAQLFFGLWLLPLGYVVYQSEQLPKVLGVLLMAAAATQLLNMTVHLLVPSGLAITMLFDLVSVIGEFGFAFWILLRGLPVTSEQDLRMEAQPKPTAVVTS